MIAHKKTFLKVLADGVCIFIFAVPLWVYNLLDKVPLTKLGFFCNDDGIRYPYHSSTVSSAALMGSGVGIVLLCGFVVETFLFKRVCTGTSANVSFHPWIVEMYRLVGYFVVGACINQFLTDIAKQAVGRPRPHFLDVCLPNVTCTAVNQHVYIENYVCERTSHHLIPEHEFAARMLDARKSFPSGHASFSMFVAMFTIIYLEYRLRSQQTRLFRHLVQLGVLGWAFWICATRLFDFKHRFSDTAAGMLLGSFVALFTTYLYIRSCNSLTRRLKSDVDLEASASSCRHSRLNRMDPIEVQPNKEAHFETASTELNEN